MTLTQPARTARGPSGPRWHYRWSIGLYAGRTPLALRPVLELEQPVLSAADVSDVAGGSVADPFLLRRDGGWFLFFEVWNRERERGEIAYATSPDGFAWDYSRVVLREPFHLSYPQVFEWEGDVYMVPETRQDDSVRLYRAEEFPERWRCVATLLRGPWADATLFHGEDRWWLFGQRGLDEMGLFSSPRLAGPWRPHPANPLFPGDRRRTRPGGRVLTAGERVLRFAQDGWPTYGHALRVFAIERLNELEYAERELEESPVLGASRAGWNAVGMHHVDAVRRGDGTWLAAVDGASLGRF